MNDMPTMKASEAIAKVQVFADKMVAALKEINRQYPHAIDDDGTPMETDLPPPDYAEFRRRMEEHFMSHLSKHYVIIPDDGDVSA